MTPRHGDRLSVIDNSFLELEKGAAHMHVGGITIFEGPPLECGAIYEHIASRLHLVPRYRQKLLVPPLQAGRPLWVDDESFNLDYHVRHTALPQPGTLGKLRQLAGRVFSQRLDRTKPLWEMWLIDGLEDDRFALITKTHHCLIDGMSGVDLISTLFDASLQTREVEPEAWTAQPPPDGIGLVAHGAREVAGAPVEIARRVAGAVRSPSEALERLRGTADLLAPGLFSPAPETPLNVEITPHRRVSWVTTELADFKAVKNALGGTLNDVVLAVVAGALRSWHRERGAATAGMDLCAMVPVSVRTDDERYQFGNRVAAMRGPLPVHEGDPVRRLALVREAMDGLKSSGQAVGAEVLSNLQDFAPPTLLAQAARINFSTRLFNVIVTNVPGPQFPLYLMGRRLDELVPLAFLPSGHSLAFAVMSYDGKLDFGLLGDYDALRDLDVVAEGIRASLNELLEAAAAEPVAAGRPVAAAAPAAVPSP